MTAAVASSVTPDVRAAEAIPGWMSPAELRQLAEWAQSHSRIVELGSFRGRSTRALADHTSGVVYAIDSWCTLPDLEITEDESAQVWGHFQSHLTDHLVSGRVIALRTMHDDYSTWPVEWLRAEDDSLRPDMIFIDGSHDYASVRRDIIACRERLAPGGLLCGHDYTWEWPGVYQAVQELLPDAKVALGTTLWYWSYNMSPASGLVHKRVEEIRQVLGKPVLAAAKNAVLLPPSPPATSTLEWTAQVSAPIRGFGLAITIPQSGRYNPPEWALSLALLQTAPNVKVMYLATKGVRRDEARDELLEKARSIGARYALMLDDDTPPPPDTILKLQYVMDNAADDVAIVGGIYCSKSVPAHPLVFKDSVNGPFWRWKVGEVFECEFLGAGCMLIKLSVLEHLYRPWFHDVEEATDRSTLHVTDDVWFCRKVRAAGYRILAHGGVLPTHWDEDGNSYSLPSDSYPFKEER